jgi:hypothetical protein
VVANVHALEPGADAKPEIYLPLVQARQAAGVFLIFHTKPDPLGDRGHDTEAHLVAR